MFFFFTVIFCKFYQNCDQLPKRKERSVITVVSFANVTSLLSDLLDTSLSDVIFSLEKFECIFGFFGLSAYDSMEEKVCDTAILLVFSKLTLSYIDCCIHCEAQNMS